MRVLDLARGSLGLVELVAPAAVLRAVGTDPADPESLAVVRVLGARHLLQAVITTARPTSGTRRLGVGVDAAHAASMIALAVASRSHRRAALCSATTATALAAGGLLARKDPVVSRASASGARPRRRAARRRGRSAPRP